MNITRTLRFLYIAVMMGSLSASLVASQNTGATISASLCGIVGQISEVIGVLALLLFIVGGTMYAAAHLLPAAGNLRGNLQGWSMGMIVGGVVGLILVLLAPSLLNIIASAGGVTTNVIPSGCGI